MKKILLLTKTLFVATVLLMGGAINAWGQVTTTLMEYGTNDAAWTASGLATWTIPVNETYLASGFDDEDSPTYFNINTKSTYNSGYEVYKTISPTVGNIINVTAVWRGRSNTGRYFSNSNGSYFRFGNIIVAQNDQDKKHGYGFAGLSNMASVTTFTAGSYRVDIASSTWLKIEMEINTAKNELTSFTIKSEDGNTTYASASEVALTSADYTIVALGYKKGSSVTTSPNAEQLKSIKITETTQPTSYANYTVHFQDNNGATVKEDEIRNGEVDATVNANSIDKTTFYNGGYKYVYANDGGGAVVANDGSAEFTVTYTKYGQFTYNVYAVNSSSEKLQNDPIAAATTYEGETATLKWSKYIKIGGQWYATSETTFYTTATEAGSRNVVYAPSDIAYFSEMENLTRSGGAYLTEENSSYSNNSRLRLSRSSLYYTPALAAGVYTISIPWENGNNSENEVYVYTRTSGGELSDKLLTFTAPKGSGTFTGIITVPEGYSIAFNGNEGGSYNNNARMDYMTLTPYKVSKTISAAGYATFCSPYALDFSGVSGLKAYIVTGTVDETTELDLTEVTSVPANEGVLLEGAAGDYDIPVIASSATDVSGNKLEGVIASETLDAGDGYVLMGSPSVGFYKNNKNFTLTANTAYLPANFAGGEVTARSAYFFRGEITGVANVEAAAEAVQKDGKFFKNGKLVIFKNGKKFNAAGQIVK